MAKVGLKTLFYAKLVKDDADGYGYEKVKKMVAPIESSFAPEVAEAELHAGDQLEEYAAEFSKGTLTLGVSDDDDAIFAELLGNKSKAVKVGETEVTDYVQKSDDIAPYFAIAQIVPKLVKGERKFKAEIFLKIKFKPYNKNAKTKGNALEFTTPSVVGVASTTETGEYEHHATLDTEELAIAYINEILKLATAVSQDGEGEEIVDPEATEPGTEGTE